MSAKKRPAPVPSPAACPVQASEMLLRDYFAGQALQALIIRSGYIRSGQEIDNPFDASPVSEVAYSYADDMMKSRLES